MIRRDPIRWSLVAALVGAIVWGGLLWWRIRTERTAADQLLDFYRSQLATYGAEKQEWEEQARHYRLALSAERRRHRSPQEEER